MAKAGGDRVCRRSSRERMTIQARKRSFRNRSGSRGRWSRGFAFRKAASGIEMIPVDEEHKQTGKPKLLPLSF